MAGIYIHIPFCSQFCTYCNFYSVKQLGLRESYVAALCNEIKFCREYFKEIGERASGIDKELKSSVTTLYIGGGTPSVLTVQQLERIVGAVRTAFDLSELEEFTIEVNPNDITPEYARSLVALGVNRVSMGVQSFVDEHLRWMNRRHSAAEGERAYAILREAGIANISLDLIFGYQGLSDGQWEYNIGKAIELAPEHISAYQMSVEPGSSLNALVRKGEYSVPPQEVCESQYRLLQQRLQQAGYAQYEISNFARDGYYSRHNSSYWCGIPYLGLGPGAHSYNGRERFWNNESVKRYCAWYNNTANLKHADCARLSPAELLDIRGFEQLTEEDKFNETIMLGLRRTCGFQLDALNSSLLKQIEPQIEYFVRKGLLIKSGNTICIAQDKLFISDSIIRELFL